MWLNRKSQTLQGTKIHLSCYPDNRLLDSLVVECWVRVREVPGSIPTFYNRLLDSLVVECWHRVLGGPGFNPPPSITASSIA